MAKLACLHHFLNALGGVAPPNKSRTLSSMSPACAGASVVPSGAGPGTSSDLLMITGGAIDVLLCASACPPCSCECSSSSCRGHGLSSSITSTVPNMAGWTCAEGCSGSRLSCFVTCGLLRVSVQPCCHPSRSSVCFSPGCPSCESTRVFSGLRWGFCAPSQDG